MIKCLLCHFLNVCNGKKYFIFDENDHDKVGAECIFKELPPPEIKQKLDQVIIILTVLILKNKSK